MSVMNSESEETVLESFLTINENVSSEIIEKKSRFIANVFYIENEDEANQKLEEIRKLHRDARHNVYAYRLCSGLEKCSDDGEPSGTGGVPILDILRGEKLFNVLVIVTRYFGGILLGTGGLVRCYGGAAKLALTNAYKVEMKLCKKYKISIDYDIYNLLLYYCKNNNIKILETNFAEKIEINVLVINSDVPKFLSDLRKITNRAAKYEEVCESYYRYEYRNYCK